VRAPALEPIHPSLFIYDAFFDEFPFFLWARPGFIATVAIKRGTSSPPLSRKDPTLLSLLLDCFLAARLPARRTLDVFSPLSSSLHDSVAFYFCSFSCVLLEFELSPLNFAAVP